ncbi:hypothetical protein HK098_005329 [Nowakowskiella sp. JEL0407]|nr:hypothetical protein HK098_005329 [Nowakowskiella sp. JEL0407]
MLCSICFETPKRFGILSDCDHIFCLECIRQWRDVKSKGQSALRDSNVIKECPICRKASPIVIPSYRFCKNSEKELLTKNYKSNLSKIPCKHFVRSDPTDRTCIYGNECLYAHNDTEGKRVDVRKLDLNPRRLGGGGDLLQRMINILRDPHFDLDNVVADDVQLTWPGYLDDYAEDFEDNEDFHDDYLTVDDLYSSDSEYDFY